MNHEAIVLAGGFGTRLKSVVDNVPKPMAMVSGKPFLYYLLNYLCSEGIEKVVLSVGYKHEVISGFFGTRFLSMEIDYAIEDRPLGTGGGIRLALKKCTGDRVFVVNGDTFFPVPLEQLHTKHTQIQAEATIALKETEETGRYGTVRMDEKGFIRSFKEKNGPSGSLINGGIYLLDKHKFEARPFNEKFSFENDYLEPVSGQYCIAGCIFSNYFIDIGIPESFLQAQEYFKSLK